MNILFGHGYPKIHFCKLSLVCPLRIFLVLATLAVATPCLTPFHSGSVASLWKDIFLHLSISKSKLLQDLTKVTPPLFSPGKNQWSLLGDALLYLSLFHGSIRVPLCARVKVVGLLSPAQLPTGRIHMQFTFELYGPHKGRHSIILVEWMTICEEFNEREWK